MSLPGDREDLDETWIRTNKGADVDMRYQQQTLAQDHNKQQKTTNELRDNPRPCLIDPQTELEVLWLPSSFPQGMGHEPRRMEGVYSIQYGWHSTEL